MTALAILAGLVAAVVMALGIRAAFYIRPLLRTSGHSNISRKVSSPFFGLRS